MRALTLRQSPHEPGRLLTAGEAAKELFCNKVSARWVIENVDKGRIKLGRRWLFEEHTVRAWIAERIVA